MITDVPLVPDPAADASNIDIVPVHTRLGNFPFDRRARRVAGTADDEPAMGGRRSSCSRSAATRRRRSSSATRAAGA